MSITSEEKLYFESEIVDSIIDLSFFYILSQVGGNRSLKKIKKGAI